MDSHDDDALQLPFLQSNEVSRFLTSSSTRDWASSPAATPNSSSQVLPDESSSPVDFFVGHYAVSPPLMYQPNFSFPPTSAPTGSDPFGTFFDDMGHHPHPAFGSGHHTPAPVPPHLNQQNQQQVPQQHYQQQQQQQPQQLQQQPQSTSQHHRHFDGSSSHQSPSTLPSSQPVDQSPSPSAPPTSAQPEDVKEFLENNKFLQFLPTPADVHLFDHRGNPTSLDLNASLYGNFFLSQPTSTIVGKERSPPPQQQSPKKDLAKYELTFYRRNLFQVIASVSNAQHAAYAGTSLNRYRILSLSLAVGVTGSEDKKPKQLLYCPPKTTTAAGVDSKPVEQEPAVKPINPKNSGFDEVVDWKRLQFRTATAHNGRKKLQNYFTITVSLYAELENGKRVCIASVASRPIVVRGRNPRFYQNRDNITLPDGGGANRDRGHTRTTIKTEDSASATPPSSSSRQLPLPQQTPQPSHPPHHPQHHPEHVQLYPHSAREMPIAGSVRYSDDENIKHIKREPSAEPKSVSDEKQDYDYEYFPMPLNYWLPPVEVVYRPHAVHYPLKFPRGKSQSMIDNSKRYFSAVE